MTADRPMQNPPELTTGTSEKEASPNQTLVATYIDFRTIEKTQALLAKQGINDGDYSLLATAGAALNPNSPNLVSSNVSALSKFVNFNHQDCGFAKKTGSDDDQRHQREMAEFGEKLKDQNPRLQYNPDLIQMSIKDRERHNCRGVALIKGTPEIVKAARSTLDQRSMKDEHDEIARPANLSPDDVTIWEDFGISLSLHDPRVVYIFDDNEQNLELLAKKAYEEAQKAGKPLSTVLTVNTNATFQEQDNPDDWGVRTSINEAYREDGYDIPKRTSFDLPFFIFTRVAAYDYSSGGRPISYDYGENDLKPEAQALVAKVKEIEGIQEIRFHPRGFELVLSDETDANNLSHQVAKTTVEHYDLKRATHVSKP